jgi:hypothetical protein
MHLHRSGHALHEPYVLWYHVEMDPHGNALSEPDPGKTGFTSATPLAFGCAFGTLIARLKLSTCPLIFCGNPISQTLAGSPSAIGAIVVSSKIRISGHPNESVSTRAFS